MKNKTPRVIEIEVTGKDAAKAGSYLDVKSCFLAIIGRKAFPDARHVNGGSWSVWIDGKEYDSSVRGSDYYKNGLLNSPTVTAPFKVILTEVI